ncbi:MAG: hypothetical protein RMI43_01905 [Candidatus Caldarchaeum sp.]|nr:hypothetical protein [Candidatus Caldarchaeum sp.]MDW8062907.1 hypothetical protein [Candidatus Caldarchaeum sp.]MDW8435462.1 hypothetical protein [Candidatus Caldarchaeum sp.]
MTEPCEHRLEYLGDQKADRGVNKYYRCVKCGDVFVHTDDESKIYRIPGLKK